jgi:hypothetical protein
MAELSNTNYIGYREERVIAQFRGYSLFLSEEDKLK